jgi:hypothetical protein
MPASRHRLPCCKPLISNTKKQNCLYPVHLISKVKFTHQQWLVLFSCDFSSSVFYHKAHGSAIKGRGSNDPWPQGLRCDADHRFSVQLSKTLCPHKLGCGCWGRGGSGGGRLTRGHEIWGLRERCHSCLFALGLCCHGQLTAPWSVSNWRGLQGTGG